MSADPACDLSIIIVSWNVRDLLRACLASLAASPGVTWIDAGPSARGAAVSSGQTSSAARPVWTIEVIVVDNASADGSAAMVAADFPAVHLITNAENRGFTAGNNQGLRLARGRYVLFLNPDTEVVGNALAVMLAHMEAHPQVGAAGPQLRYGNGTLQPSRRRFPTLAMGLFESTPLAWHWPDNPWARRYRMADRPADQTQPVDWIVGAALMARRQVLDQVGGFDEGYFMYSEELDWCRRARSAGWGIVYLPAALIIHYEGKSSEQAIAARHIRFQTSKLRYFHKFHGRSAAVILRLSVLALFAVEWFVEAVKWLLGSRRHLRRERMAAYALLLRSRLRAV